MTRKEKDAKRSRIGESMDLGRDRFKDPEIDSLLEFVTNPEKYDGLSRTKQHTFSGWSSDGRYSATERSSFTIKADEDHFSIEEKYQYDDDDGETRERTTDHTGARDIFNILRDIFEEN